MAVLKSNNLIYEVMSSFFGITSGTMMWLLEWQTAIWDIGFSSWGSLVGSVWSQLVSVLCSTVSDLEGRVRKMRTDRSWRAIKLLGELAQANGMQSVTCKSRHLGRESWEGGLFLRRSKSEKVQGHWLVSWTGALRVSPEPSPFPSVMPVLTGAVGVQRLPQQRRFSPGSSLRVTEYRQMLPGEGQTRKFVVVVRWLCFLWN